MRQYFDQKRTPARVGVLRYAATLAGLSEDEEFSLIEITRSAGLTERHANHLIRRLQR